MKASTLQTLWEREMKRLGILDEIIASFDSVGEL